jgi:hypothetical protein
MDPIKPVRPWVERAKAVLREDVLRITGRGALCPFCDRLVPAKTLSAHIADAHADAVEQVKGGNPLDTSSQP